MGRAGTHKQKGPPDRILSDANSEQTSVLAIANGLTAAKARASFQALQGLNIADPSFAGGSWAVRQGRVRHEIGAEGCG
jgi:hypothetical protein